MQVWLLISKSACVDNRNFPNKCEYGCHWYVFNWLRLKSNQYNDRLPHQLRHDQNNAISRDTRPWTPGQSYNSPYDWEIFTEQKHSAPCWLPCVSLKCPNANSYPHIKALLWWIGEQLGRVISLFTTVTSFCGSLACTYIVPILLKALEWIQWFASTW